MALAQPQGRALCEQWWAGCRTREVPAAFCDEIVERVCGPAPITLPLPEGVIGWWRRLAPEWRVGLFAAGVIGVLLVLRR